MKNKSILLMGIIVVLICLAPKLAYCKNENIEGIWQGTLNAPGLELTVVFKISRKPNGNLTATIDSPDQGSFGIPVDEITFEDGNLHLESKRIQGVFEGKIKEDGLTIEGQWEQGGGRLPLTVKHVSETEINKLLEDKSYTKVFAPNKFKEDLDFLFRTIQEVHPNMYAYTSKKSFAQLRDQLYSQINKPMNRLEFYKAVAPVVASLKNGHTFLQPPFEFFQNYAKAGGKYFPMEIQIDEESVILTEYQGPYALPIGAEVLTLDGVSAVEFLRKAARYMPSENKPYNLAMIQRKRAFPFYLWLEKNNSELLDLQLKTTDGLIEQFHLKALGYEELVDYQKSNSDKTKTTSKNNNTAYSYRYIPDYNVGLIEFNSFRNRESFLDFLKNTFGKIREQNVCELIIDIRKNPGGNSTLGDDLLKYLTDSPFRQFEEIQIRMSRQLLEVQPGFKISHPDAKIGSKIIVQGDFRKSESNQLIFKGRVFVLIGPKSASSSVSFASAIKRFHIGTLIGQETIDTTVNYGDCVPGKMPNSGLDFRVACKHFVEAGGKPDGRGVIPDYEVKQKPEDTAKGVDTVLQFTLDLIKKTGSEISSEQKRDNLVQIERTKK